MCDLKILDKEKLKKINRTSDDIVIYLIFM